MFLNWLLNIVKGSLLGERRVEEVEKFCFLSYWEDFYIRLVYDYIFIVLCKFLIMGVIVKGKVFFT